MKSFFNFETKYRSTGEPKLVNFETGDGTYWTLSEEWICEEEGNIEHVLFFRKENFNFRGYTINIEITSLSKGVSGIITATEDAELRITKFTVPICKFDVFKYSSHPQLKVQKYICSQKVLEDSFRCKVIITRYDTFDDDSFSVPNRDNLTTYSDQILSLCYGGQFSDIVLASADSSDIPAHRAIMAARSKYFFNVFKDIDSDPAAIFPTHFNFPVLCDMLCFMYSGQVRPMNFEEALSLYTVANVYLIPALEDICHDLVVLQITVNNASDLLLKADSSQLPRLKICCTTFIAEHFDEIRGACPLWAEIETNHPKLFDAVLNQFG